ncbi:SOS response-associated peptidase [Altererythrobacter sp.]|uniref:SOS response-associated peptidase n=1 Tax=Altererythrobacter sp. TaxID=1872480 RepID=UPI003CFE0D03
MCNLYRMTQSRSEVAKWFDAEDALGGANFGAEVFPGYPGAVVAQGKLQQMHWGFPLILKGKSGQKLKPKPVNNARSDKLDSFFWRDSFDHRRCLVPATAWAEAEGPKGGKTRTWLSLPGRELFAFAGVWRDSDEWGACYSIVITEAAGAAAEVHTRMPVVLAQSDYRRWIEGTPSEASSLCHPWEGDIAIDRTGDAWSRGGQSRLL